MLQKSSMQLVLDLFFISPTKEYTLKEISTLIKLAHTSVKRNLLMLVKQGLIMMQVQKKGNRSFPSYKAKMENPLFKKYKKIANLQHLLESGLVEFLEENIMPKSIVLFGSYSRGEDIESSDIDIFIEGIEEKLNLTFFEKKLKKKIELHYKKDFISYPNELKNNIINGIVLYGFLEGYD